MLPFSDVGINPIIGNAVVEIVQEWISSESDEPLDIEDTASQVGRSAKHIRPIMYLLAATRTLKMTFIPYCRECGNQIGGRYTSSFLLDDESFFCESCNKMAYGQRIEIRIEFWRPSTPMHGWCDCV